MNRVWDFRPDQVLQVSDLPKTAMAPLTRSMSRSLATPVGEPVPFQTPVTMNQSRMAQGRLPAMMTGKGESVFVEDEDDALRMFNLAGQDPDKGFFTTEVEHEQLRKMCSQTALPPGWCYTTEELRGVEPSMDVTEVYEELWAFLSQFKRSRIPVKRVKRGTNHGSPDWQTSDESLVWHVLFGRSVFKRGLSIDAALRELEDRTGVPRLISNSSTQFVRGGPTDKSSDVWNMTTGVQEGKISGFFGRARWVFGYMAWANTALDPITSAAREMIWASPHAHVQAETIGMRHATARFIDDDISGYDRDYGRTHNEVLYKTFYRRLAGDDPRMLAAAKRYLALVDVPVLTAPPPPYSITRTADGSTVARAASGGMLLRRGQGVMISGHKATDKDGTLTNMARTVHALARSVGRGRSDRDRRRSIWDALSSGELLAYWQGDDTLLGEHTGHARGQLRLPDSASEREAYDQASREFGFRCKLGKDPVFLMKRIVPGGAHALKQRFNQQACFPERRPDTIEAARYGTAARVANLAAHPKFSAITQDLIQNWPFKERLGSTLPELLTDYRTGKLAEQMFRKSSIRDIHSALDAVTQGSWDEMSDAEIAALLGIRGDDARSALAAGLAKSTMSEAQIQHTTVNDGVVSSFWRGDNSTDRSP